MASSQTQRKRPRNTSLAVYSFLLLLTAVVTNVLVLLEDQDKTCSEGRVYNWLEITLYLVSFQLIVELAYSLCKCFIENWTYGKRVELVYSILLVLVILFYIIWNFIGIFWYYSDQNDCNIRWSSGDTLMHVYLILFFISACLLITGILIFVCCFFKGNKKDEKEEAVYTSFDNDFK